MLILQKKHVFKTICPDIIGKVEKEKPSVILHSILLSYLFLNQCQKIKHMSKPRQSTHALLSLNWILVFRYEPAKMDIYPRWSLIVYIFFANYIRISNIYSVLIFLLLFCIPKTSARPNMGNNGTSEQGRIFSRNNGSSVGSSYELFFQFLGPFFKTFFFQM